MPSECPIIAFRDFQIVGHASKLVYPVIIFIDFIHGFLLLKTESPSLDQGSQGWAEAFSLPVVTVLTPAIDIRLRGFTPRKIGIKGKDRVLSDSLLRVSLNS